MGRFIRIKSKDETETETETFCQREATIKRLFKNHEACMKHPE